MAKHYDDIPCIVFDDVIHIAVSGFHCACGRSWRQHASDNIVWLDKSAVTCPECLAFLESVTAPLSHIRS